jgi:hypothetical protein
VAGRPEGAEVSESEEPGGQGVAGSNPVSPTGESPDQKRVSDSLVGAFLLCPGLGVCDVCAFGIVGLRMPSTASAIRRSASSRRWL